MKVSHGDLALPAGIAVALNNGTIEFTWEAAWLYEPGYEDQAMVLAYDIENGFAIYSVNGELRRTGRHELKLSSSKRTYHLYFAMVAADRSRQSDNVYLGTMVS